jgi:hypothetical protein
VSQRPGDDADRSDEDVLAEAGFHLGADRTIAAGPPAYRNEDEIVASVFSLSYAAPSLFGPRLAQFERDMRALLRRTAPDGRFCEQLRSIRVNVCRTSG